VRLRLCCTVCLYPRGPRPSRRSTSAPSDRRCRPALPAWSAIDSPLPRSPRRSRVCPSASPARRGASWGTSSRWIRRSSSPITGWREPHSMRRRHAPFFGPGWGTPDGSALPSSSRPSARPARVPGRRGDARAAPARTRAELPAPELNAPVTDAVGRVLGPCGPGVAGGAAGARVRGEPAPRRPGAAPLRHRALRRLPGCRLGGGPGHRGRPGRGAPGRPDRARPSSPSRPRHGLDVIRVAVPDATPRRERPELRPEGAPGVRRRSRARTRRGAGERRAA
jgi:hypothetical protein